jgi:flagellar biosynthesis/type III secretory pathway chaperone
MDKKLLDKFSEQLNESLNQLNELKNMAEDEKVALIECDYDELDRILKQRDFVLAGFQDTVKELEVTFPLLSDSKKDGIKTLTDLCQFLDEPYSSLFKTFPGEFHSLVRHIHESNLRNMIVLNHCKELIYDFLCSLAKKVQPKETYSSLGMINKPTPPAFITNNF